MEKRVQLVGGTYDGVFIVLSPGVASITMVSHHRADGTVVRGQATYRLNGDFMTWVPYAP